MKTTNGGTNWIRIYTGIQETEGSSLCFLNANTGWIGCNYGSVGHLYKTTNGGNNWVRQDFPGAYLIKGIKFFDINNGWILGLFGYVALTTNGGTNWIQKPIENIPPATSVQFYGFSAQSITNCFVLVDCYGSNIDASFIYKTSNGGDNWNLVFSTQDSIYSFGAHPSHICFINSTTGILYGDTNYTKTTNSGINWTKGIIPGNYNLVFTLLPINNNVIFAGGGGHTGYDINYIWKSTDAGSNWVIISKNTQYFFSQIQFVNSYTGMAISDYHRIYRTSNSGNNWILTFNDSSHGYNKFTFINLSTGFIIGNNYSGYSFPGGLIFKTTNSGYNWTKIFDYSPLNLLSIKFSDQFNGFIGCDSNRILKTSNAGLNWSLIQLPNSTPYNIEDINFINNSTGWLLGHYYFNSIYYYFERNAFWKTTNCGSNWNIIFDSLGFCQNLSFQFLNNDIGYKISNSITNYDKIHKTTNGGANWLTLNTPNILDLPNCLNFVNQFTGWIGGEDGQSNGVVLKTTNSGVNWTLQFNENHKIVKSLYAFDSDNAWLCGDYSSIYKTTNGGGTIGINQINNNLPLMFVLSQNYPNPFNPTTKINYDLPKDSKVTLVIYDILGRQINKLVNNEFQKAGAYSVTFNGQSLASGVYFYRIATKDYVNVKKMILIK